VKPDHFLKGWAYFSINIWQFLQWWNNCDCISILFFAVRYIKIVSMLTRARVWKHNNSIEMSLCISQTSWFFMFLEVPCLYYMFALLFKPLIHLLLLSVVNCNNICNPTIILITITTNLCCAKEITHHVKNDKNVSINV
jgi:hypothetical protein